MNSDFVWNLQQTVEAISKGTLEERAKRHFIHPHDAIWLDDKGQFTVIADKIYNNLGPGYQYIFLSICLASHLLNQKNSPKEFTSWFQSKTTIKELLGLDFCFDEITSWSWERSALPGVDLVGGWNDKVVYALVGSFSQQGDKNLLMPSWANKCMNKEAQHSVQVAADLLADKFPGAGFLFWPMLDPEKHSVSINGNSLGLPVYLSFLSVVRNLPAPEILATGALGTDGKLLEVGGLEEKLGLAHKKGFSSFIYPLLAGMKPLETIKHIDPKGITTLEQAAEFWFGSKRQENSRLLKLLMPVPFENNIRQLSEGFVGRNSHLKKVEQWVADPGGSKILFITGGPGMGKSALAAKIASANKSIVASHFCDYFSEPKRDPAKLIRSIAYQLVINLPEYAARLGKIPVDQLLQEYREAYTLFDNLIIEPLKDDFPQPEISQIILIDALDEASSENSNDIASLLSRVVSKLPTWLRILITSRPEPEIVSQFHSDPQYELSSSSIENKGDLSAYLQNHFPDITAHQIEKILERSEGSFLYVRHICAEIQKRDLNLESLEEIPKGLNAIYYGQFERKFGNCPDRFRNDVRPLLCQIAAANEPLSVDLLKQLLGLKNKMELYDRLNQLGSLFPSKEIITTTGIQEVIIPWHLSVIDWLNTRACAGPYYIDIEYGHSLLADYGWEQYKKADDKLHPYFLAWLPTHLAACDRMDDAVLFLKDFNIMMARAKAGLLERVFADFREIRSDSLVQEAAFFEDKTHILRRGDDSWPTHKVLLQISIEHADDSPLTQGAEQFLKDGKCDWPWLRNMDRPKHTPKNPWLAVFEGHTTSVNSILVMPDGRILSWSADDTLRLWTDEGQLLAVLEGHTKYVVGALLLPDGCILSWSADNTLRLWKDDGTPLAVLEGHTGHIGSAILLPDGRILSWSWDNTLRLWKNDGTPLKALEGHTDSIHGALLLSDGGILSWSFDGTLRLWKDDGTPLTVLEGHSELVNGALLLPDGRILSWSRDNTLRMWNDDGTPLAVLEGHSELVHGALLLPDGRILTWSQDYTLRLWNNDGTPLAVLEGHTNFLCGVLLLPDGRILSWSYDKTLRLWKDDGTPLTVLEGHSWGVAGALLLPDSRILSWSRDNTLRLWEDDGRPLAVFEGFLKPVNGAHLLPNGQILSWSETMYLWNPNSLFSLEQQELVGLTPSLMLLPNGKILSWSESPSRDNSLRLWNVDGTPLAVLEGHTALVQGVLLLPDGRILSWSRDNTLRLWKDDGTPLGVLEGHTEGVYGALLLPNCCILSWASDNTLRLWKDDGTPLVVLEGHTGIFGDPLMLADGCILSWLDETLMLWKDDGTLLSVFEGHTKSVLGALLLPDGCILSWSEDQTMRMWKEDGTPLAVLEGNTPALGALLLPDGRIFSWSWDTTPRLWKNDGTPLAVLKGHTNVIRGTLILNDGLILSWDGEDYIIWDNEGKNCRNVNIRDNGLGNCRAVKKKNNGLGFDELQIKKQLSNGKIVFMSNEYLYLWNPEENSLERHDLRSMITPEIIRREVLSKELVASRTASYSYLQSVLVEVSGEKSSVKLSWQGRLLCNVDYLFPNGSCIVTDGQICFLRLYIGDKQVSVAELESFCS